MNKEKMLAWAEALESGKYNQCHFGYGEDFDNGKNEFCCLNVACHIESGYGFRDKNGPIKTDYTLAKKYGLDRNWMINTFVGMNDHLMLSFPQIAQEIRKMVENA